MKILKVSLDKLQEWEDNPRDVSEEDFERLKKQLERLPVFKPLVAYKEGNKFIVLGGNMRLKAYRELGREFAFVSLVDPESEQEKLEISLADNDQVGYYLLDQLAAQAVQYKDTLDLELFHVQAGADMTLKDVIGDLNLEDSALNLDDVLEEGEEAAANLSHREEVICPKCGFKWQL